MAVRLDGRIISGEIRKELQIRVNSIRETISTFSPGLAIVQGKDKLIYNDKESSILYTKNWIFFLLFRSES
jgi:hypothetical protein